MPKLKARKSRKGTGAACDLLPFFSKEVAEEAFKTLRELRHHIEEEPLDVVYCNRNQMEDWIRETVKKHFLHWCDIQIRMKDAGNEETPPQSFSVAVESNLEEEDPLVSIVLDVQSTTKPLSQAMGALKMIARHSVAIQRSEDLNERFGECWLCLDNLYDSSPEEGSLVCCDVFCCGHPVCVDCSSQARTLERCGVCRRRPPNDKPLKDRLRRRAMEKRAAARGQLPHEETLNEVLSIMEMLDL